MDLTNYLSSSELIQKREQFRRIFFYRICGTGMGAAACLLKERGLHVEGADSQFYPPMGDYLRSTAITCHRLTDFDPARLKEFDLIVVGNVVPRNSDDARTIENSGVPFCSFPAALGAFVLNEANVVGIAGTHGKTTTTYFATQVFENLGQTPGYLIGGVMEGRPSARLGDGRYFFIESDEYDSSYFEKFSKFQSYEIDHLLLTSLEFDHADIFRDLEAIKDEFRKLLGKLSKGVIHCSDYDAIAELRRESQSKRAELYWAEYGSGSGSGPKLLSSDLSGSRFELGAEEYRTNVTGPHNILNLAAVILFARQEGFSVAQINQAIGSLKMVRRRQELRGHYRGTPVIDDFAHHPRAVDLTLKGLRAQYSDRKMIVVLEANSATARSNIFEKEFESALENADEIIFTKPTRPTSVAWAGNLDIATMAQRLSDKGKPSVVVEDLSNLMANIEKRLDDRSVLVILSNGTCLGLWESDFVGQLAS